MGKFDRIIKENIEAIFQPMLGKLLGLSIKRTFEIKDKIQSTIEREPDFLKKIVDEDDYTFILHLEFQTSDDSEMRYRMAEYKALIQRKYKLPVRQIAINLAPGKSKMESKLPPDQQITGFELMNISDFPTETFLSSEIPEEIIFAILADYPQADAGKVVNSIIHKLQSATSDEMQLRRMVEQLLILSRLRKLDEITEKTVNQMPITYDITEDYFYKEGLEKGDQGRLRKIIFKALRQSILTIEQISEMADVDVDYVLKLKQELGEK